MVYDRKKREGRRSHGGDKAVYTVRRGAAGGRRLLPPLHRHAGGAAGAGRPPAAELAEVFRGAAPVEVCRDAAYLYREGLLMELKKVPVKIYNEAECTAITSEGVTVRNADAREYTLLADTVIWAGGYLPMEDEAEQFRTLAYDFWKIGDCAQVRKIYNARREGYNAGSNI